MRYAYGLSTALLIGGATVSLITGQPAGAQVAQNDDARMSSIAPRAGAPASFADLTAQLQPSVVNISTRQRVEVQQSRNPFEGHPVRRPVRQSRRQRMASRKHARRSRSVPASSSLPMAMW